MKTLGVTGRRRGPASVAALGMLSLAAVMVTPAEAAPRSASQLPTEGRFVQPVFDEVDVTEDVPYHEAVNVDGELQTLHLDLYEPAGDTAERRPVVMLIHGGFFVLGNHKDDQWGAGPSFAEPFARMGYVVVSIQYRLRPDMGFFPDVDLQELEAANLDAYDDSVAAIEWLDDHAAELRLDPRAIVPVGPSAGGAMAWNLAWMQGSSARPEPSGVPAAVSVAGAPFEVSFGTGEPLAAASAGDPPVLAFHGTDDTTVPLALAEGPCSRAAAVGVDCDLVTFEGVGHPGIDPEFLAHLGTIQQGTVEFIAEVVLAPLGYFDESPPEGPGPQTPEPDVAPPAQPVAGRPAFTG